MRYFSPRTISYLGTFTLGAIFGAALLFEFFTRPWVKLLSLATLAKSSQDAYVAYRYGNYPAGRDELLNHVKLLRGPEPGDSSQSQSFDLMLSYARLASRAERAGETADSKEFWRRAMESWPLTGAPPTEKELRQTIQHLDASWDKRLNR